MKIEHNDRLLRTPKYGLPIGLAVETACGDLGIEVQRKNLHEIISLSELILLIHKNSSSYGMIYSSKLRIPIGCAVRTASGEIGIEIKRGKDLEVISIKTLVSLLVHTVDAAEERRVPA